MSKILVVEDDLAVRDIVGHSFSREGMKIEFAADGEEALECLEDASSEPSTW